LAATSERSVAIEGLIGRALLKNLTFLHSIGGKTVRATERPGNPWARAPSYPRTDRNACHSCRRATMGSTWAAWMAGYRPNKMPTVMLMSRGRKTPFHVRMVAMPEKCVIR